MAHASKNAEQAIAFLSRLTGVPASEITPAKALEVDLGVDSLMRVEIAAFLETRFGARLSDEQQLALRTVGDVLERCDGAASPARSREPATEEAESTELVAYWERELARADWDADGVAAARSSLFHALARSLILLAGRAVYAIFFRLRAEGREHLPEGRRYIIAANHASHLDSLAVLLAAGARGRRLRVVGAKDYFFNTPLKSWFFGRLLRAIPFDRYENFLDGLRSCRQALEQNDSLLIFPEGTRSTTGELQPFKLGLGVLAHELDVPVIPTYIRGAYDALPKGRWIPRPAAICVHFGAPIASDGERAAGRGAGSYEAYKRTVEGVRAAIEAMRRAAA
jgi:long-chain acyl-CoA synthetase